MYVQRLQMENIRGFYGAREVTFSPGLNYLVGENNAGKSTVLHALEYLREGTKEPERIYSKGSEHSSVIMDLAGEDLESTLESAGTESLKPYLFKDVDAGPRKGRVLAGQDMCDGLVGVSGVVA